MLKIVRFYFHLQGGPKSKLLSRTIIKPY